MRSVITFLLVFTLVQLPAVAAVFQVTDIVDAIPAPEGSLRWAIERSEANNEPDSIVFIIDGGTIDLVAPLPSLRAGRLTIGRVQISPHDASLAGGGIIIDGGNEIPRAIAIFSSQNTIANLEFTNFAGEEVIQIAPQPYNRPSWDKTDVGQGIMGRGIQRVHPFAEFCTQRSTLGLAVEQGRHVLLERPARRVVPVGLETALYPGGVMEHEKVMRTLDGHTLAGGRAEDLALLGESVLVGDRHVAAFDFRVRRQLRGIGGSV